MLQFNNLTPFIGDCVPLVDEKGVDRLCIFIKATFQIGPQWTLAEKQQPLQGEDVYHGEPGASSLSAASDYHFGKSSTDILMMGSACAAGAKPIRVMDTRLTVGNRTKVVRVFGDRQWENGRASRPELFDYMPIIYEKAFGGGALVSGHQKLVEERNPVGIGYSGKASLAKLQGAYLPNIEFPNDSRSNDSPQSTPAGYGPIAPDWLPRRSFAGTYDESWRRQRAPFLPADFDRRFFNVAPVDQQYAGFLQGGEPVKVEGMHPNGPIEFAVPQVRLVAKIRGNRETCTESFTLDTLNVLPNELQISLVWRSSFCCNKDWTTVNQIDVSMTR